MKIVQLKTKMIEVAGMPEQEIGFADMMLGVLQAPAQNGLTMHEIVERMPVINAIKAAQASKATSLLLEDAQWAVLNRMVSGFQHWRLVDQFVVDLGDAVSQAKTYEPPPPPAEDVPAAAPMAEAAN